MKYFPCGKYAIILTDYEIWYFRIKWNKIRSFICRRHISHLRSKYFISKIFHSFRKERISLKKAPTKSMLFSGGSGWIRTTEVEDNRFTVCPLWPLGNTPKSNASYYNILFFVVKGKNANFICFFCALARKRQENCKFSLDGGEETCYTRSVPRNMLLWLSR